MTKLADADRAFVTAIGLSVDALADASIERGRFVSLPLARRLGALAALPRFDRLRALEGLDVSHNRLRRLDLSKRPPRLAYVHARNNAIASVTLTGAFDLETLDLRGNALRSIDLTPLLRVDELLLSGNPLQELRVTDLLVARHPKLKRAAKRVIARAATAHELHYACDVLNWDAGDSFVRWVVKQPQCDPATALMIYFRASPSFWFAQKRPDADAKRAIAFLRSIESRFARGAFHGATVAYDPVKDVGADAVRSKHVPEIMRMKARPVRGAPKYPYPRVAG